MEHRTEIAHLRTPPERDWIERRPFVYADGTEEPPALLRDEPEQNFLKSSSRIFGLVLLGIAWSVCIGNTVWIAVNRKHRVLTASQPLFLYQLALGSAVVVAAIFPLSFDESYGWSEEMLASACTSLPWLIVTGHVMQYMALFAKVSTGSDYTCNVFPGYLLTLISTPAMAYQQSIAISEDESQIAARHMADWYFAGSLHRRFVNLDYTTWLWMETQDSR